MQEARERWARSLGREDPLEEERETHSSIVDWENPRTEEPGGLQSTGSQSQIRLSAHTCTLLSSVQSLSRVRLLATP